jgi:hypothetical protein
MSETNEYHKSSHYKHTKKTYTPTEHFRLFVHGAGLQPLGTACSWSLISDVQGKVTESGFYVSETVNQYSTAVAVYTGIIRAMDYFIVLKYRCLSLTIETDCVKVIEQLQCDPVKCSEMILRGYQRATRHLSGVMSREFPVSFLLPTTENTTWLGDLKKITQQTLETKRNVIDMINSREPSQI